MPSADQVPELVKLARGAADAFGIERRIVLALCEQESAWNPWAIRYEPGFYRKYVEPQNLRETEERAQAFSWGLMQVMGLVAREHGFTGRFLSELCDPMVGLEMGCKVFKRKFDRVGGDLRKALLAYNGGGRPEYADEVLAKAAKYE